MNLLICSKQFGTDVSDGFEIIESGDFRVCFSKSNNITIQQEGQSTALISGILLGPLQKKDSLFNQSVKKLCKSALESNGSFAVVISREKSVTVVADCGGSIPLYYGYGPKGFALGTPVHEVAKASGLTKEDDVSKVDYLMNHVVCYPYTWYKDVYVVPPGSVVTFHPDGKKDIHTYWQPTEQPDIMDRSCDVQEWAERLRFEVKNSIDQSLQGCKKVRVLFSGGEDSRAVLGLIPKNANYECIATTVLENKNREYRLADKAAKLLGYELDLIERPIGFYRQNIIERAKKVGLGRDLRNTHMFGEIGDQLNDSDILLGAYSSDTLFKTHYMSNIIQNKRGVKNQLKSPVPDNIEVIKYLNERSTIFKESNVAKVIERRKGHHDNLLKIRPITAGNWHGLWPVSNRNAYSYYLSNLTIGPKIVEPFIYNKVYQLASEMPDICRINRDVFYRAFAKEMGWAGWLPTSGGRIPRARNTWMDFLYRLGRKYRRKLIKFDYEKGYQGSWSPDEGGWYPVNPKDHFDDEWCEYLNNQLEGVLKDGDPDSFWNNPKDERSVNAMKVRALALAFRID